MIPEKMNVAGNLHAKIAKVCPIIGISIGDYNDKQTWSITFADEATTEQRAAAETILSSETASNLEKQLDSASDEQQVNVNDLGFRPSNILFYYGYPNSFNSLVNGWVNEKVCQDMAAYDLVVLGDGVEDPSHPDYANTQVILPRIKEINPNMQVFGYVACTETWANFQAKVDQWDGLQAKGIFIDEAGYDFGTNRSDFNARVDYVHGKTNANTCFVNSWNLDHVLGLNEDASYPNSTWNSSSLPSSLTTTDWALLESFPINTTAYSGTGGYEPVTEWQSRLAKAISLRKSYGIKLSGVGVINDDNAAGQDLFNFGYISALMCALEAYGTSSLNYGASTAQVKFWTRPDLSGVRKIYELEPTIKNDTSDTDIHYRFVQKAKLLVDFSSGAQTSSIIKR